MAIKAVEMVDVPHTWNDLDVREVGTHDGGYSTFRWDVTDFLAEENQLTVHADNSRNDRVYPQKVDFTFYGGIVLLRWPHGPDGRQNRQIPPLYDRGQLPPRPQRHHLLLPAAHGRLVRDGRGSLSGEKMREIQAVNAVRKAAVQGGMTMSKAMALWTTIDQAPERFVQKVEGRAEKTTVLDAIYEKFFTKTEKAGGIPSSNAIGIPTLRQAQK